MMNELNGSLKLDAKGLLTLYFDNATENSLQEKTDKSFLLQARSKD